MLKTHKLLHRRFDRELIASALSARDEVFEEFKKDNPGEKNLSEMAMIHKRYQRRDEEILERLDRMIEKLS